jgi:sialic acid synthase
VAAESFAFANLVGTLRLPTFTTEIGCNHMGSFDAARKITVVAKSCGAGVARFQKRTRRELLTP